MHWRTNKNSLTDNYLKTNPDLILINSHGLKSTEPLKIPGYKTYRINYSQTLADGSAIAIKHNIQHNFMMILTLMYLLSNYKLILVQ